MVLSFRWLLFWYSMIDSLQRHLVTDLTKKENVRWKPYIFAYIHCVWEGYFRNKWTGVQIPVGVRGRVGHRFAARMNVNFFQMSNITKFKKKNWLTEAVWINETAEKCHLSNLSNTPQNFCPMMILTIGHKMGQKNCPWVAPGILGSISYEFWRKSSFAVNNNLVFWNWLRMLLLDWIFMRKRVFWKFPICLPFWLNLSNLAFSQFWQCLQQKSAALST